MRRRVIVAAVAAGVFASACGGGGTKRAQTAPETQQTTAPTVADTSSTTVASDGTSPTTSPTATTVGTKAVTSATTKSTSAAKKSTVTTAVKAVSSLNAGIGNVAAATTTAPNKAAQPGGTMTFAGLGGDNNSGFYPWDITGRSGPANQALFDFLVYTDPTDGQVKGQTADSLVSTDAVVWTLKIKPNIKFTDGTPYDAEAVKYNWEHLVDPNTTPASTVGNNVKQIDKMEVTDPLTLKMTLKAKNAVFPQSVALIPYIGSPTAMRKGDNGYVTNPVGAGPFTLKEWVRDDHITLVRNPNYWNAPLPYLDQIIVRGITEESQRINTFKSGAANTVYVQAVPNAAQLGRDMPSARQYPIVINGGTDIHFNTSKPPFSDIRARQAIAMAIDRADYVKVATEGLLEPMDSVFRHDSPFYDPTIVQQPYDPTKAQQLFDQLAAETGGPLTFDLKVFNLANYQTTAAYVQGVLNKFRNVKVSIVPESSTQLVGEVAARTYIAAVYAINFVDPEPAWTGVYLCNANPSPTGWCNTKFDADTADNKLTLDPKQRVADIKDAQRQFYAEVPTLFLERRSTFNFTATDVQDYQWVNAGNLLVDRVWIKSR